jgi:hypothetical protein
LSPSASLAQIPYPKQQYEDGIIPDQRFASRTLSMSSKLTSPKALSLNILSPVSPLCPQQLKSMSTLAELEGCAAKEAVELGGKEVVPARSEMPDFEKWEKDEEERRRKKDRNRERARKGMSWLSLS